MNIVLYRHDSSEPVTLELSDKEFNALKHFINMGLALEAQAGCEAALLAAGEKISAQLNKIKFN